MIVSPARRSHSRRSAFTLLEVLVVVAIIVVLASVSSIYVFKFFDDSKKDKALMDMQALNTAYQSYKLKTDEDLSDISQLAPYMTQGTSALSDPYGNRYQIRQMSNAEQHQYDVTTTVETTVTRSRIHDKRTITTPSIPTVRRTSSSCII